MTTKKVNICFGTSALRRFSTALLIAGLVAGCAADDPTSTVSRIANGTIFSGDGVPGSEVDLDRFRPMGFCPLVVIPDGWGLIEEPVVASEGDRDPTKVAYQAAITKTARECRTVGDVINIRLGIAGRVTLGPAASSTASVDLPLTLDIYDRASSKTLSSEQRRYSATFTPGQPTSLWQVVYADLSVPAGNKAIELRVGFAPGSKIMPRR